MKKNIIVAIALMVVCLQQLNAQDSTQVSSAVAKRFQEAFAGAKNVYWMSLPKNVTQAQFYYKGAGWLAYFDGNGNVITSGRRIKAIDALPLKVHEGLLRAKARAERKGGNAEVLNIYEMMKGDQTRYFVSFRNEVCTASFYINSDGITSLELKRPRTFEPQAPRHMIAKKN